MRALVTAVVIASSAVLTVPAAAQSIARPKSWTLTPFLHTSVDVGRPAPDDSIGLGFAVGYDWTANLGFEGELSHLFDVAGDSADLDWSVTNFSANAIYHFDVKKVTPYATFGIGLERSGRTFSDSLDLLDESSNEVAVNFGGGVKYLLNDSWFARADLRRFASNDVAPDYWRLYAGLTYNLGR